MRASASRAVRSRAVGECQWAPVESAAMAYQSLYRRYRPQKFGEVRGQDHLVRALRNAVVEGRVGHAYLFSGPRGTGKTSTARILAKVLNCEQAVDGEPCGVCESCQAIEHGSSFDVFELDAASNNGVEAIRSLIERAQLGSPGRTKVYILDEVHMLSTAASNALLKTLEEPPGHVVFVLATTDPQKVLPTIRSRTQHFEFRLLGGEVLTGLLHDINADAALGVPTEAIDLVARRGHGSARDALSVLDQVAAAGSVEDEGSLVDDIVEALCDHDVGRALAGVADACATGREPRRIAEELLAHLRNNFLAIMARGSLNLADDAADRAEQQGRRLGPAALVRAMEALGDALMQMREALDPRVSLEVALVRIARPEVDTSPAALVERIERLERGAPAAPAARQAAPQAEPSAESRGKPRESADSPAAPAPAGPKKALGAIKKTAAPKAAAKAASAAVGALPTRDELTTAWADSVLPALARKVSVWFKGRFSDVIDGAAVFALEDQNFKNRAEKYQRDVEAALEAHFGRPVPLQLTVDDGVVHEVTGDDQDDDVDFDAPLADTPGSPEDHVKAAFPGAEEVTEGE